MSNNRASAPQQRTTGKLARFWAAHHRRFFVEDNGSNGAGAIPVLDSIQEFRLQTSTFDPEYGNFSGAVINVITKSGTNQFHGSVFEFLRNTDLDAKTCFNSSSVFSQETLGVPGNSRRLFFTGPGTNNFDMALHKVTPITERVSLEFRAEFFNAFNHAQFQAPVGNFAASNFSQVTGANAGRIGHGALRIVF